VATAPVRMLQCKHISILQCKQIGKHIIKLFVWESAIRYRYRKESGNTSSCIIVVFLISLQALLNVANH